MKLLAVVDQILNQIGPTESLDHEERVLGLPSSLTGIDIVSIKDVLEDHRKGLEKRLGREVHPVVALLDLAENASDRDIEGSAEDFCLLKKTALLDLIRAALYDTLTGLYSRNSLESRLREEFRRARRYDIPLSVLFIETDGFKNINDTYGHVEGDRVLAYIGRFIRRHIREVDFPARYGGDEFMVILPHTTGETALGLAHRIHDGIGEDQQGEGLKPTVTISIGVGTLTADMRTEEELVEAADRATYRAKAKKDMVWPTVNGGPTPDDAKAASQEIDA